MGPLFTASIQIESTMVQHLVDATFAYNLSCADWIFQSPMISTADVSFGSYAVRTTAKAMLCVVTSDVSMSLIALPQETLKY